MDDSERLHLATNGVAILLAKALAVIVVVVGLGRYAGPMAIDAHDNVLLAVGIACFALAAIAALFGVAWVADGVLKLVRKLEGRS